MILSELKSLLSSHADRAFRISLPDGSAVPVSFHVTEVGRVQKTFLDCGGKLRETVTCQLQIWVGPDFEHRLETGKMASILNLASAYLPDESIPVEIEYENEVISQYTISSHELTDEAVVLKLANKHTECLAPELCGLPPGLPPLPGSRKSSSGSCCGPAGCC
ncbi:hypothetical protein JIN85_07720 [Luteolibacter pohnpeiensis]|uniref:Uncharacterized protein n=1 Tax=Luteolibacter pohnpeiensis TaxID=454153 RepID=A0A934S9U5_9BACT|nr:DUF6428 family protein [Luteolibacter pohnpeiensis]MBK1882297.1 hypothetical protein [Luteolibacter pohnpeiensis]